MPQSQNPPEGDGLILSLILDNPNVSILDIGSGEGKWGKALHNRVRVIDGLEIWEPNIVKYELTKYYDCIYNIDIMDFRNFQAYDIIILGDVLEHLRKSEADALIDRLKYYAKKVYLTIPISRCEQDGNLIGNPYESHLYQWTDEELTGFGFKMLHRGFNPNGLVLIGTYSLN